MDTKEKNINITDDKIKAIEDLLKIKVNKSDDSFSIKLKNEKTHTDIHIDIIKENNDEYLISVYTTNAHLQIQSCKNLIISEMLEEMIFISESGDKISGLIISKQGDCSLYSNVDRSIISSDFSNLTSEKLLSAVALSVIDSSD